MMFIYFTFFTREYTGPAVVVDRIYCQGHSTHVYTYIYLCLHLYTRRKEEKRKEGKEKVRQKNVLQRRKNVARMYIS